jgi:hypothetical protein
MRIWATVGLLALACVNAGAQNIVSARAGLIHYLEGRAYVDKQRVRVDRTNFPHFSDGEILRTDLGRAEVLLAPGVFLRIGENSAVRMTDSSLEETQITVEDGSALVEVVEFTGGNRLWVWQDGVRTQVKKSGLYRFDADSSSLRVYDGEAELERGGVKYKLKRGKAISLASDAPIAKFDTGDGDGLHRWAGRRSVGLAMANISAAKMILGPGWRGLAARWMWNPYFGLLTYVPRSHVTGSFGSVYYTPDTVNDAPAPAKIDDPLNP